MRAFGGMKAKPTPSQLAEWQASREANASKAKTILEDGLRALQSGDDWTNMLARVAKTARAKHSIRRYSFANQILLFGQSQGMATACATFKAWQDAGRQVRKGEKGLIIRQPKPFKTDHTLPDGTTKTVGGMYFGTLAVFDISQTDGPPVEAEITGREAPPDMVFSAECLRTVALTLEGSPVSSVTIRPPAPWDPAVGWYQPSTRAIVVHEGPNAFAVLAHEVAHAIMHGTEDRHTRPEREVEAESVAFIVCHALGCDTSNAAFGYVAGWAGKGTDAARKVQESGERILKAANKILDALFTAQEATT